MAPRLDLISFWQSGHVTSEVSFGLWPLLVGLIEDFSISSLTIHKFLIPTNFSLLCPVLFSGCVGFSIISVPLFKNVFIIFNFSQFISNFSLLLEVFKFSKNFCYKFSKYCFRNSFFKKVWLTDSETWQGLEVLLHLKTWAEVASYALAIPIEVIRAHFQSR